MSAPSLPVRRGSLVPRRGAGLLVALAALAMALIACGGSPKPSRSASPASGASNVPAKVDGETFEVTAGKPFHFRGRAGAFLQIENTDGRIEASTSSDPEVEITADVRDGGDASVVVTRGAGGLTVCVRPERAARAATGSDCDCVSRGHLGRPNVTVTVRVPEGLHLIARTVNGRVHVQGVVGRVEATAVNGQVLLEDVRDVHASSVNGQVRATFADGPLRGPVELSTVNGQVAVSLPANADAELRADTVRGHIAVDVPGARTEGGNRRGSHVRVALGHGGHEVSLRTVHGSIHVEERHH